MNSAMGPSGNPFEDRARGLKVQRLALVLWEAGARSAGDVRALTGEQRGMALEVLGAGLGKRVTASAATWRGVASMVGWLGGGSGGRRRISRTAPSRLRVPLTCGFTENGLTLGVPNEGRRTSGATPVTDVENVGESMEKGGD